MEILQIMHVIQIVGCLIPGWRIHAEGTAGKRFILTTPFQRPLHYVNYCDSRLNVIPVFANCSLLVILIEKEIAEMNLDIDRVIRYIFLIYI